MPAPLSRRRFLQLSSAATAAAAGSTLLSACGGSSGSSATQTSFWYAFGDNNTQKYWQQNIIDVYNKTAKAKVVMSLKQVSTLDRLLQTAVAAGNGPDIISTSGPAAALSYANSGNLLALDPYVDKYGWAQTFLPWALDAGRVDGKLYSLPANYETMAVFYNTDTFAKHGWKP